MKKPSITSFYAVRVTIDTGEKFLCWQEKDHLLFAEKKRGYKVPPPPTLFRTKKEANEAIKKSNMRTLGVKLLKKKFHFICAVRKVQPFKVLISFND